MRAVFALGTRFYQRRAHNTDGRLSPPHCDIRATKGENPARRDQASSLSHIFSFIAAPERLGDLTFVGLSGDAPGFAGIIAIAAVLTFAHGTESDAALADGDAVLFRMSFLLS
ncbi:hypothetical protein HLI01_28250 [Rhizobium laguerreae]|uniref:hypothetical protein n=1 Tax=Rhizobium laguerreae TaxID=1076926 RepID=UPI0014797333|nr:hypothetical protein [Rhizobium laguerreae]NNH60615.1 hypothetical protein [Rhizobium laguerreae]